MTNKTINRSSEEKLEWKKPCLETYGSVESLTHGPKAGYLDQILGTVGIGDGDGGYADDSFS